MRIGFDNEKYLAEQSAAILERVSKFENKLYLEFGGKLLFDYHASRVLPGFDPNVKIRLLQQLRDKAEVLLCIYAGDIERKKIRADFGITYDVDALKLMDDLRERGIGVTAVVITRFENQPSALLFRNRLERRDIQVCFHRFTKGYPTDVDTIVSDEGYGANDYIQTTRPIVVVTGPGPLSGKLATCLSQVYHEWRRGTHAGYAKFETFPIWSLPLKHPVNVAYEAATADIRDFNLIDPFHLEAYNIPAVNYNRDVEAFPLVRRIIEKITREASFYKSPTDMGVNRAGYGITDDDVVRQAATQEVIRRFLRSSCEYAMGVADKESVQRCELLMNELGATPNDRTTVSPALQAAQGGGSRREGERRNLLRRRDRAEGRDDHHREEFSADALGIRARHERSQIPRRPPRLDSPFAVQRDRVAQPLQAGRSARQDAQPGPRRDAHRAQHQRDAEPGRAGRHREAQRAEGLRNAPHTYTAPRRRGGAPEARRQRDQQSPLHHEPAVPELTPLHPEASLSHPETLSMGYSKNLPAVGAEVDVPLSKHALQFTAPESRQLPGAVRTDRIHIRFLFDRQHMSALLRHGSATAQC